MKKNMSVTEYLVGSDRKFELSLLIVDCVFVFQILNSWKILPTIEYIEVTHC